MSFEIRKVEPGELAEWARVFGMSFGERMSEDDASWLVEGLTGRTCRAAFEDGSIVATSLDEPTTMMLPGGVDVPVIAVTFVGTLPTHRRRGAMRGMMEATLADARERGVARAALWVSEVGIYGRFGFGPATLTYNRIEVDTVYGAYAQPFADVGRVRLVDPAESRALLTGVYERARRDCPGDLLRSPEFWRYELTYKKHADRLAAVHEDPAGTPDGFAVYKYDSAWRQGVTETRVECSDLVWSNRQAHAALWRHLLDLDLVKTVDVALRPPDDPIRWLLADQRHGRFGYLQDGLWVSLLDVPRALAARRYAVGGALVIEVDGARLLLESADDGAAECSPTTRDPDVALSRQALASCHLGGYRFSELAGAGLVEERKDGALRRADLMFQAERAPWCMGEF